ncbi:WbqC family protein [Vibrio cyclitrophicus 1F53]|uniref:WbqC family protein n=1 Tax=Vibrio cyclitrophicus TaxID=47951 RepID=UPI00030F76E8|nr:WbqC family protein [Vibrio cyclitrophicus]OEF34394.1 hypothetical protein OA7_08490 [Vibrio cyclitrophicus 1F53]OEF67065.1 hypothetical protein OAA_06490 [Vibrio cyclitrophicus 1F175]PMH33294.1 hypothetical protein BCU72_01670 [Vibrio cyclitrophicus]PMH79850.1 hypothetical protein BCU60_18830 [Vibrio cyclitrophicus]
MYVTIHQPYFLPWLGYFSKLAYSSHFIVLDDVDFRKRHYLDRTRIVNMHGDVQWINVPVGQNYKAPLHQVTIKDHHHYIAKIIRTIESSYSKARNYEKEWPYIKELLLDAASSEDNLVDLNIRMIVGICNRIDIRMPTIIKSSEMTLGSDLEATSRIEAIFHELPNNKLLIGDGKSSEVHDLQSITTHDIEIYIQEFSKLHPTYTQTRRKFLGFASGLSILDCMLNEGSRKTQQLICGDSFQPVPVKADTPVF